jgi:WD40 repeat protein
VPPFNPPVPSASDGRKAPAMAYFIGVAVAFVVAGAVWFFTSRKSEPAKPARSGSRLSQNADPPAEPTPEAAIAALPKLPDGQFEPGGIKLSSRVIKLFPPDPSRRSLTTDGEHYATMSVVQGVPVYRPIGETEKIELPFPAPADTRNIGGSPIESPFTFSPDGKRFAYFAATGNFSGRAVIDGTAGPEYQGLHGLTFSPDGKHVAYTASPTSKKAVVVIDGQEYDTGWSGFLAPVQFSPDSRRVAYAGHGDGAGNTSYAEVKVDHKPWPRQFFTILRPDPGTLQSTPDRKQSFTFSANSQHVAIIAQLPPDPAAKGAAQYWNRDVVLRDGVVGNPYLSVVWGTPTFSPDGSRLVYAAWKDTNSVVVVDNGVEGKTYADVKWIRFSPNGKRLAIGAHRPRDPNSSVAYSRSLPSRMSAGNENVGEAMLILDGVEQPGAGGGHFVFSPSGKRYAMVRHVRNPNSIANAALVIDGKQGPTAGELKFLQFSPDGAHVACVGMISGMSDATKVIIDGIELKFPVSGVVTHMKYTRADMLEVWVSNQGEVRQIELRVVPAT